MARVPILNWAVSLLVNNTIYILVAYNDQNTTIVTLYKDQLSKKADVGITKPSINFTGSIRAPLSSISPSIFYVK